MNAIARTSPRTRAAIAALLVVALALLAVLAAGALSDDTTNGVTAGDRTEEPGDPASGTCLEGATDCADDPTRPVDQPGGAASGACLAGAADCADDPSAPVDPGATGMCAPGVTDCVDVAVGPDGAGG